MTEASGKPVVSLANDVAHLGEYFFSLLSVDGDDGRLTEEVPDSGLLSGISITADSEAAADDGEGISFEDDDSGIDIAGFDYESEHGPDSSAETMEGLILSHLLTGFFNGWVLIEYVRGEFPLREVGRSEILLVEPGEEGHVQFVVAEGGIAQLGAYWRHARDVSVDRDGFNVSISSAYCSGSYRIARPELQSQPVAEPQLDAAE